MSNAGSRPGSALRGRYLVRNRGWNGVLRLTDAVLSQVARAERTTLTGEPQRILIAVGGQLGDAVIATGVIPALTRVFPNAELGMLLPSWSRAVVADHPLLRWMHHADHWKISRTTTGRGARWRAYQSSAALAVSEIRDVRYDAAIDLYAYYPNAAWLLWRAGIPVRVGYTSGGCGPLYTHAVDWRPELGHTSQQHQRLLRELATTAQIEAPGYDLPPSGVAARERARGLISGRYVVIHPGTGDAKKSWPPGKWRELIERLEARGEQVVLTGAGERERREADELTGYSRGALNLVGALDWPTFRVVVANAVAGVGPDSVAMHVAAAEGTPAVVIMAAISDPEQWRPLGERVAVLTHEMPCAPCFRKEGCVAMACVRNVAVDDVLHALDELGVGEAQRA